MAGDYCFDIVIYRPCGGGALEGAKNEIEAGWQVYAVHGWLRGPGRECREWRRRDFGGARWLGRGGIWGLKDRWRGDAEEAAERTQGAADGAGPVLRGGGQDGLGLWIAEQVFEVGHVGGGPVADDVDQPGVAARDVGRGGAVVAGGIGVEDGIGAGFGEGTGEQAGEAAAHAADAGPDREGEAAEQVLVGADDEQEGGEDRIDAGGQRRGPMGRRLGRGA